VWLAGVVVDSRAQMTRRGMMRVVELDDGSGRMEVTVFTELYESRRSVLKADEPLIVSAKVEHDDYSGSLRGSAVEILTLAEARLRYAKGLMIRIKGDLGESKKDVDRLILRLQAALIGAKGSGPGIRVFLELKAAEQVCEVALGEKFRVSPDTREVAELFSLVAPDVQVTVHYA
jgi:DNA polymerase-3 subunit alpha